MPSSPKQEQLRQLLKEQQEFLRQTFPTDRYHSLLALIHASNWHYFTTQYNKQHDISRFPSDLQKALFLYFSTQGMQSSLTDDTLELWAASILEACSRLAEAERILAYCDTGFMRMQQDNNADYTIWIAGKKMPTEWREREDIVEWTRFLALKYADEMRVLDVEKAHIQHEFTAFLQSWDGQMQSIYKTTQTIDAYYHRLGVLRVKMMVPYTTYPDSASIGGCTFALYRDVLSALLGLALKYLDACQIVLSQHPMHTFKSYMSIVHDDTSLINQLATTIAVSPVTVRLILNAYTMDAENVVYHSSHEKVPAPPLIRLDEHHRSMSLAGLLTHPLFFLMRELKRKYSYEYHTVSQLREEIFRQDMYTLFADKRFVKSVGHVELRGTKDTLTTDVDALIFDRKTGALALFELKSQDPFAYSLQERTRQRDYFYSAGKQVIASSEWVKRNGANALLSRLDFTQIKRFKAQNVYIFVLGRYLAHFFDGPPLDARAAWGTWSQVLRLTQGKPFGANDSNPIQSLHNKLTKDTPLTLADKSLASQEIVIENRYIRVYPSFEVYRNNGRTPLTGG